MGGDRCAWARRSTRALERERRAADRWAASRRSCRSTIPTAPSGTPPRSGPTKRQLRRGSCCRRLQARFAPGGLLHHGQGKWYPGEPLPRWALTCYFRKDGEPIWRDPSSSRDERRRAARHAASDAPRALIAQRSRSGSGVDADQILPAYEDAFYYLWRERRLPAERRSLLDARLDDAHRARAPGARVRAGAGAGRRLRAAARRVGTTDHGNHWRTGELARCAASASS